MRKKKAGRRSAQGGTGAKRNAKKPRKKKAARSPRAKRGARGRARASGTPTRRREAPRDDHFGPDDRSDRTEPSRDRDVERERYEGSREENRDVERDP
jgi:hypothetical protein